MWWSNLHELVRVGEASSRYHITFNLSLSLSLSRGIELRPSREIITGVLDYLGDKSSLKFHHLVRDSARRTNEFVLSFVNFHPGGIFDRMYEAI